MSRAHAKPISVLLSAMLALSLLPSPALAEMAEETMGAEQGPVAGGCRRVRGAG